MKFSIKEFFNKCDQIRRKQRIWSHLMKKSLMENFIFVSFQSDRAAFLNKSKSYLLKNRLPWCVNYSNTLMLHLGEYSKKITI